MLRDFDPRSAPRLHDHHSGSWPALHVNTLALQRAFERAQHAVPQPLDGLDPGQVNSQFLPRLNTNTGTMTADKAKSLKPAAVLIALVPRGPNADLHIVLTRRTAQLRTHAGEIALPGGRRDANDADDIACAVREAEEETALPAAALHVLGTLPLHISGSGYSVRPVVALLATHVLLRPNPAEVQEIFEVPLNFILNPRNHFRQHIQTQGKIIQWWAMPWENPHNQNEYYIWGATAGILRSLYNFLKNQLENNARVFQ